jgi:hypothetical protein
MPFFDDIHRRKRGGVSPQVIRRRNSARPKLLIILKFAPPSRGEFAPTNDGTWASGPSAAAADAIHSRVDNLVVAADRIHVFGGIDL